LKSALLAPSDILNSPPDPLSFQERGSKGVSSKLLVLNHTVQGSPTAELQKTAAHENSMINLTTLQLIAAQIGKVNNHAITSWRVTPQRTARTP